MCKKSYVFNSKSVPTYRTRTIAKKACRTSVPYLLARIEAYRTVPTYRNVLPSLMTTVMQFSGKRSRLFIADLHNSLQCEGHEKHIPSCRRPHGFAVVAIKNNSSYIFICTRTCETSNCCFLILICRKNFLYCSIHLLFECNRNRYFLGIANFSKQGQIIANYSNVRCSASIDNMSTINTNLKKKFIVKCYTLLLAASSA